MARKRAAKGSKTRVAGASMKSMGLVGAMAAALAGGGYYIGKNGADKIAALMPEKIAALLPAEKAAPKATPEAKADAKPAESAIAKLADKAELTRLLKGAEAKIVGYVRPEPEKRVKTAKAEARKADAGKAETSKAEASKTEPSKTEASKAEAKSEIAKVEAAKPEAKAAAMSSKAQAPKAQTAAADADAPVPPARIPDTGKADTGKAVAKTDTKTGGKTEAKAAPAADDATASIANALAEPEAAPATKPESAGGSPLGVALTGKGIPTSEDSKIRLSVGFSNRTGKPIRAFEGVLKFTDRADRSLFSSKISVSALIAEGGTINWDERVDPDKLGKKLVDSDKDSLKAVFVPKKVFFVDGSVEKYDARG